MLTYGPGPPVRAHDDARAAVALWACIALFFLRVVGQVEVLLVAPGWLPEMQAWYSGLLPYPLLLPLQIAILMLMCGMALKSRDPHRDPANRSAKIVRPLAVLYFLVMAARLLILVRAYGAEYYLHGAIPVAFHWVLALFLLVWSRPR
jgi:hypothetical protein